MISLLSSAHGPGDEHSLYLYHFLFFVGVIVYLVRKYMPAFVTERRKQLLSEIEEARKLRDEAEAKLTDYESRLTNLQTEIDHIMEDARNAGEQERERILSEATKTAERIRTDAADRLGQEQRKLSHELRIKAVEMALDVSRQLVTQKITNKDHERFVSEYVDDLEEIQGGTA